MDPISPNSNNWALYAVMTLILLVSELHADTVLLKSGQEIDGIVTGVTDTAITLETDVGSLVVPKEKINQVFIGDDYRNASPDVKEEMLEDRTRPTGSHDSTDKQQNLDIPDSIEPNTTRDETKATDPDASKNPRPYIWLQFGPVVQQPAYLQLLDEFRTREYWPTSALLTRSAHPFRGTMLTASMRTPLPLGMDFIAGHSSADSSTNRDIVERGYDSVNPQFLYQKSGYGLESVNKHNHSNTYFLLGYPLFPHWIDSEDIQMVPRLGLDTSRISGTSRAYYSGNVLLSDGTSSGFYNAIEIMELVETDNGIIFGLSINYLLTPVELELEGLAFVREGRLAFSINRVALGPNSGYIQKVGDLKHEEKGYQFTLTGTYWIQRIGITAGIQHELTNLEVKGGTFFSGGPGGTSLVPSLLFQALQLGSRGAAKFGRATILNRSITLGIKYTW